MNEQEIQEAVIRYRKLRDELDELKNKEQELNEQTKALESRLLESMTDAGMTRTALYEGVGFIGVEKPRVRATVPTDPEQQKVVFDFMKSQGAGELIKFTVHSSTYATFVAGCLEAGTQMPEQMQYYLQQKIKLYRR